LRNLGEQVRESVEEAQTVFSAKLGEVAKMPHTLQSMVKAQNRLPPWATVNKFLKSWHPQAKETITSNIFLMSGSLTVFLQ